MLQDKPKGKVMSTQLKSLADIYTGFTQRPPEKSAINSEFKTVQIKDLARNNSTISESDLSELQWAYDFKPQFLKRDSIIVVARGDTRAYLFQGDEADQVVVSNQFIVINLKTDLIQPEFLVWYLNHAQLMRTHFDMNSRGVTLSMLSVSTLKDAPIVIPSLEQQKEILTMQVLAKEEASVFQRLTRLRMEYNQSYSDQILMQAQATA